MTTPLPELFIDNDWVIHQGKTAFWLCRWSQNTGTDESPVLEPIPLTTVVAMDADFRYSTTDDNPIFSLSMGSGLEIVDAEDGQYSVEILPSVMKDLPRKRRRLVYDIRLTFSDVDEPQAIVEGSGVFSPMSTVVE